MKNYRWAYFRFFGSEVFAEYPSVTRGHSFFDYLIDGGELLLWVGRFHAIFTPPTWRPAFDALQDDAQGPLEGR